MGSGKGKRQTEWKRGGWRRQVQSQADTERSSNRGHDENERGIFATSLIGSNLMVVGVDERQVASNADPGDGASQDETRIVSHEDCVQRAETGNHHRNQHHIPFAKPFRVWTEDKRAKDIPDKI